MLSKEFFDYVRLNLFHGQIDQIQVNTLNALYDEAVKRKLTNNSLAYVMATVFHETARRMDPAIEEYGKGKGRFYGDNPGANSDHSLNRKPPFSSIFYYGRSLSQLTWCDNYMKMGSRLLYPLAEKPELLHKLNIAVEVLMEGMEYGLFTGRRLTQYFSALQTDYVGARRIINPDHNGELIAGYASKFYEGLKRNVAQHVTAQPVVKPPTTVPSAPLPPAPRKDGLWANIRSWFGKH